MSNGLIHWLNGVMEINQNQNENQNQKMGMIRQLSQKHFDFNFDSNFDLKE